MADEEGGVETPVVDSANGENTEAGIGTGVQVGTDTGTGTDSGNQDAGPRRCDDQGAKEAAREAARPAVMRRLQKLRTYNLDIDAFAHVCGDQAASYEEGVLDCPFSRNEIADMAKALVRLRVKGEREYLNKIRQRCMELRGDLWSREFSLPESENAIYEYLLEKGVPYNANSEWDLFLDPGWNEKKIRISGLSESIYGIEVSRFLIGNGFLMLSNMSLQTMCEIGNHFEVDPAFFLDHVSSREFFSHEYYGKDGSGTSREGVNMVGVLSGLHDDLMNFVFDTSKLRDFYGSGLDDDEPQRVLRLSCMKCETGFFIVSVSDPQRPSFTLIDNAPSAGIRLPATTPFGGQLRSFFCDAWILRRLFDLTDASAFMAANISINAILWLCAVWLYERRIRDMALNVQELDYESVTLTTSEALDRVKKGRARVAQLRKDLALTKQTIKGQWGYTEEAYRKAADLQKKRNLSGEEEHSNTMQHQFEDSSLTPRQLAASSMQEEYIWLDQQAAALMPLLNENLQVIIATLNVEQSKVALKNAEVSLIDVEISRRNGERSTQLTLLAAIYLPFTLATGIFGMNIKDINEDEVRYWWPIVLAIVLMIPSAVVIAYIFWRSRQDRMRERERLDKGGKEA